MQKKHSTVGKDVLCQSEKNYLKSKSRAERLTVKWRDTAKLRTIEEEARTVIGEVCNLRSVVIQTFGVISLCGFTHGYSKIERLYLIVVSPGKYPIN
jgi:hypothetical protein